MTKEKEQRLRVFFVLNTPEEYIKNKATSPGLATCIYAQEMLDKYKKFYSLFDRKPVR
jgi:hypothetical protein